MAVACIAWAAGTPAGAQTFRRADANADARVDLSDGVRTLNFLFLGDPPPPCLDAADANDSGRVDLSDAVFTFDFLFVGGPKPPPPGLECGGDPTGDTLGCAEYLACGPSVTASLTASPLSGPAPLVVRLSGLESSSSPSPLLEYRWTFGDGESGTGPLVVHTFGEPGAYTVTLEVEDGEGRTARASETIDVDGIRPATIVATRPTAGEVGVALTRETVLEFRRPVESGDWSRAVVTSFAGETLPARYHLSPDGRKLSVFYSTPAGDPRPLPAGARVRVRIDGGSITDDLGRAVDADGDGEEGGVRRLDFDTVGLVSVPGTAATGTVMASEPARMPDGDTVDVPLAGVTIRVDGLPELTAFTGADGRFRLEDAPAGTFFVHIDGKTVTDGVPAGAYYPSVGKSWRTAAGQELDVGTVFLPLIADGTLQPVRPEAPTEVEFPASVLERFPDLAGVRVTVPAGSLFADDGTRGGAVGIAPVAPDRLPGTLPETLRFPLVITLQTDGPTNFDAPAPVVFPNLPDPVTGERAGSGETTMLWSFDHDRGQWAPAGPATVSAGGERVVSVPGTGIRAPGWHGVMPAIRNSFDPSSYGSDDDGGFFSPSPPQGTVKPSPADDEECEEQLQRLMDQLNTLATCAKGLANLGPSAKTLAEAINTLSKLLKQLEKARQLAEQGMEDEAGIQEILTAITGAKNSVKIALAAFPGSPGNTLDRITGVLDCMKDIAGFLKNECQRARKMPACFTEDTQELYEGCDDEKLADVEKTIDSLSKSLKKFKDSLGKLGLEVLCDTLDAAENELSEGGGAGGGMDPSALAEVLGDLIDELEPFARFEDADPAAAAAFFGVMTDYFTVAGDAYAKGFGVATEAYVSFEYGDSLQRTRADSRGGFGAILPVDTPVVVTVFNPRSGKIGSSILLTGMPGTGAGVPYPVLGEDLSEDGDGDGLGEAAEDVVGTDPQRADTDGDGISDGAELAQGTDPLDDRIAETGVIGTVPLPDPAEDFCLLGRYAVVAHGNSGVSVIDIGAGRDPTVIARVDTPGRARSVACAGSTLVVADDRGGLAVVDASDPPAAEVVDVVPLPGRAGRVATRAGLAFVSNGSLLSVVEVATKRVLDTRGLDETIRDVVVDGDALWVLSSLPGTTGSHSVLRLPIGPEIGEPEARFRAEGEVRPAFVRSGLFVDREQVYVAGIYDGPAGDPGVEVLSRDGGALELLAPPRPTIAFDVALDGSGRALFAGVNGSYASADVGVLDVSDPADPGGVLSAFPVPGRTNAVTVAGGLGYAAADDLHVVSYIPYDALGVPPSVRFAPSTIITEGLAEEGQSVAIGVDASDDVQLREVQLVVDGGVVSVDSGYPFDFEMVTPSLAETSSFTLQARAVDTGGNAAETASFEIELVPDGTPPEVTAVSPEDGSVSIESAGEIYARWSEPIDAEALGEDALELVHAGPDGELGTGDDGRLEGATLSYRPAIRTLVASYDAPFPPGRYGAAVSPSISDLAGNKLASAYEWSFEIIDTPDLSRQEAFEVEGMATGGETVHSFFAPPGRLVYFDERVPCDTADVRWECFDEDGDAVVPEEPLEDCGTMDAGRRVLERGGRYDIRVTGLGTYRFAVRNVITTEFEIEIGDTVEEDVPAPGAGRIDVPGEIDLYYFVAAANTELYFDEIAPCGIHLVWELRDEDGTLLFGNDSPISGCVATNQGSMRLERGGLYSLLVEGRSDGAGGPDDIDDGVGAYSFRLWPIEPGSFEIAVGDTVSEGDPGPGAGTLESPGNYDVYTFQAQPGTTILFDELAPPCGASPVWDLFDPDGAALFEGESLEDCFDLDEETVTIERSGVHTIVVRVNLDLETTFTYSFGLVEQ